MVRRALLGDEIRLLTVGGPAGIGKTRLAVEAAKDLASGFPDGVWFIDLVRVTGLDAILLAIVEAFGMRGVPAASALDFVQQHLQDRRLLLILDNFEHVSAGAGVLSDLLAAHSGLRILVTSRHPLRLKWEHALILGPLHVPSHRGPQSLDEVATASAIQLFVQSAQAVRLDFTLTSENVDDVAAICAYLEGVPLAIELAASWITLLPPATIRKYLDREPSFLRSRLRDIPARQQSLVAALDWSYDLLDQREQALLRRLSVFIGGFTIEAVMAVAGDPGLDILDILARLVDASLLQLHADYDGASERRFYLLETVRTYALVRLEEHQELENAQRDHAEYYLYLAERERAKIRHVGYFIAPGMLPLPEDTTWRLESALSYLDREYANLQAALSWTERTGETEIELRLANALSTYWWVRPLLAEGTRWLEDAIHRNPDSAPAQRARALAGAGMLLHARGQLERARQLLDEALSLARIADDQLLLGEVLINAASARTGVNDAQTDEARALVREALAIWQKSGDVWGVALARLHLGIEELFRLQGGAAEGLLMDALSGFERLGDTRGIAVVRLLQAVAAKLRGDGGRATSALAEAIRICRDLEEPHMIASCAEVAAWLVRADDPLRAATLVGASDGIRESGFARNPYEQHLYAQVMDSLKARVPEQELELARKQGRSLTAEQILDMLEDQDALPPGHELEAKPDADSQLSDRELEIIRLMGEGMSNQQIAETIFVSEGTVKLDIRSIYRKLGAHNRAQALGIAAERGLI